VTERVPRGQWLDHWHEFSQQLQRKLDQGYREYGDGSFDLPLARLVHELQAECLDIAGWGLILWVRLNHLEKLICGDDQK